MIIACRDCLRPLRFIKNALGKWEVVNMKSGCAHHCHGPVFDISKAINAHTAKMRLKDPSWTPHSE